MPGAAFGVEQPFASLPPESFAHAFDRSGVSPQALGSGYAVFFLYSSAIGVFAVA